MNKTTIALATFAALAAPSAAHASTVKCKPNHYFARSTGEPPISNLLAINLPKKTDGYAPRCLVAESVMRNVLTGYGSTLPKTIEVMGARWYAGKWGCKYEERQGEYDPYMHADCRSKSVSSRRVTFGMGA